MTHLSLLKRPILKSWLFLIIAIQKNLVGCPDEATGQAELAFEELASMVVSLMAEILSDQYAKETDRATFSISMPHVEAYHRSRRLASVKHAHKLARNDKWFALSAGLAIKSTRNPYCTQSELGKFALL
jgi:hypothetical protein